MKEYQCKALSYKTIPIIAAMFGCLFLVGIGVAHADDLAVYHIGTDDVATQLASSVMDITPTSSYKIDEIVEHSGENARPFILIADKSWSENELALQQAADAGVPVIIIETTAALTNLQQDAKRKRARNSAPFLMVEPGAEESESPSKNNYPKTDVVGYYRHDGTTYVFRSSGEDAFTAAQSGVEWAQEVLFEAEMQDQAKTKRRAGGWTKTLELYIKHDANDRAGQMQVKSSFHWNTNDGDPNYWYWVYEADHTMIPGRCGTNCGLTYGGTKYGNAEAEMFLNVHQYTTDGMHMDSHQPTSSSGTYGTSIGFGVNAGLGISATGPSGTLGGSFTKTWSYTQPDVECRDRSNEMAGLAKWNYNIRWDSNPGSNTLELNPGAVFRTKQGVQRKAYLKHYSRWYYKTFWVWRERAVWNPWDITFG